MTPSPQHEKTRDLVAALGWVRRIENIEKSAASGQRDGYPASARPRRSTSMILSTPESPLHAALLALLVAVAACHPSGSGGNGGGGSSSTTASSSGGAGGAEGSTASASSASSTSSASSASSAS